MDKYSNQKSKYSTLPFIKAKEEAIESGQHKTFSFSNIPKPKSKAFLIVIIISSLVLIALVLTGLFVVLPRYEKFVFVPSPTPADQADISSHPDWKDYQSPLGFSIKYPDGMNIHVSATTVELTRENGTLENNKVNMVIEKYTNPDDIWSVIQMKNPSKKLSLGSLYFTVINGNQALRGTTHPNFVDYLWIISENKKEIFFVTINALSDKNPQVPYEEFETMLASFKFTESVTSASPTPISITDWKTFSTNTYSIKYPSYWVGSTQPEVDPTYIMLLDNSTSKVHTVSGSSVTEATTYKKWIVLYSKASSASLNDYVNNFIATSVKKGFDLERKTITINGITGEVFKTSSSSKGSYMIIVSDGIYATHILLSTTYPSPDPEMDKILSTFKLNDVKNTPTPTCTPKPACLNASPKCLINEPSSGWCP